LTSTEMLVALAASNAPGRKPITSCVDGLDDVPSSVYAEAASLMPLVTVMSACAETGVMPVFAPATAGGQTQLYCTAGPVPS